MYKILLGFVIIFALSCKNQKQATAALPKNNEPIYSLNDAFDFQGLAMKQFNAEPRNAMHNFIKAATAYIQNGKKKDAGICYGNAAHLYEEQLNNLDSAFMLSKLSLDYAIQSNDTLNTGHGYRYTGVLMGMKNMTDEGIQQIEKSIPYYKLRRNNDAIAVAQCDMARVYFLGKKYDKASEALKNSTEYFKSKTNLQRIFNNNLLALELFKASGNKAGFDNAKFENENLIQSGKISEILKSKFTELTK